MLIIHDEKMDDSYVSMAVGSGSLQDPEECLGLAHFCEVKKIKNK